MSNPTAASAAPTVLRESTAKLGLAKGHRRYYAAGGWLKRAGFLPGLFVSVSVQAGTLELRPSTVETSNRVSSKADGAIPVVDLNSSLLARVFGEHTDKVYVRVEAGRIVLSRSPVAAQVASRPRDGTMGAAFAGGGILDSAAVRAGFTPKFAIELDEKYAAIYEANHPTATMYNMSVHEVVLGVPDLPRCELFCCGIPCEPFSNARSSTKGTGGAKRDRSLPATAHPLGDMTLWTLALVARIQPRTIVIEEAAAYAASETGVALAKALERMGYVVSIRELSPHEFGWVARRKRTVMVAQTPEADGTVPSPWPKPRATQQRVADILDADVPESAYWDRTTKAWVFEHADAQTAAGNGFVPMVVRPEHTVLPTITKRYFAQRGSSPMVAHPTRLDTYRWLTLTEAKRAHDLPISYDLGTSKTTAGEAIGQSVHAGLFAEIVARATGRVASDVRRKVAGTIEASHPAVVCDELPLFAGVA